MARAAASLYGLAVDARDALWATGVLVSRQLPVPVISIGGITAGGAGKTPLAAALAGYLADRGVAVGIVTPGEPDELLLHGVMNPDVVVTGGRRRLASGEEAIRQGARALILDSGFQHRRLHRDLDIVALAERMTPGRHLLPAGPYRERLSAIRRADAVVLVRRGGGYPTPGTVGAGLRAEIGEINPHLYAAEAVIEARGLVPANQAARAVLDPRPALAVAGVMWPEPFFAALASLGLDLPESRHVALRDHAPYERTIVEELAGAAGGAGIVCTRKDAVKLAPRLPEGTPAWWVEETVRLSAAAQRLFDVCYEICVAADPVGGVRRSA